jgi:hypothetical protein
MTRRKRKGRFNKKKKKIKKKRPEKEMWMVKLEKRWLYV